MRYFMPLIAFLIATSAMWVIMSLDLKLDISYGLPLAIITILSIIFFSLVGLFEKSIMKYVLFSTIIQFSYFALDVATAFILKKSIWFAILQFINFSIAGLLFTIPIVLLYSSLKKPNLRNYSGVFYENQFLGIALIISCLALGGMPGFNIFVGEFIIYSSLFAVHPALAMSAVFAGLVCFLFYFRICYVILAGHSETPIKSNILSNALMTILAILTIALGVIPQILFKILEWYT